MTATQTWNTTELVEKDKAHLLHPVSNLKDMRANGPLVLAQGEGVYLWDTDGKRYIDAFAGLWNVNVGHGRKVLADAAAEQIMTVDFVPNFFGLASPPSIELAAKLAEIFPGHLNHFQFTSGGAESNETSLKIARYYWWLKGKPEKIKIISRRMGYHGIAMGALAATGIPTYHEGFGPMVPGYVHVSPPYAYRFGEGLSDDEFVSKLVQELEDLIAAEGADTIAAMIGEPVTGAGGVVVPPAGYWPAIREDADEAQHPADRRRGHLRLRPHRPDVRRADVWLRGRHRLLRQGHHLRLHPAGRLGRVRRDLRHHVERRPHVHARLHLFRPSGRLRRRLAQYPDPRR